MRVAVVGASGNVGSSVLAALADEPSVTEVVALARRVPDLEHSPYQGAQWHRVDLASSDREELRTDLRTAFEGADAVVHLVWAIQPNHARNYMRRVNVDGTRLVAEAAVSAGVPHLVVASSWAVYSPVPGGGVRDETAERGGIRSSHYSVDKAAQEQVLDEIESAHPDLVVARMRTALVFRAEAGAEIVRYFLGPVVPRALLRPGLLPFVPLPKGLRLQVVHGRDVGRAYAIVVTERAAGAFNVAATQTLGPQDVANLLGQGRYAEIPAPALRPLLHYGWRARLLAPDAGWLDMAMNVPVMDTARIRSLGWTPQYGAEDTLREMLVGMHELRGTPSPAMRPGQSSFGGRVESLIPPEGESADSSGDWGLRALPAEAFDARVPGHIERGLLGLYLADHLAGATAGRERIRRMAAAYADRSIGPDLARISNEIAYERELLRELIHVLGLHSRPARTAGGWLGERIGRAKANRRVFVTSPVTPLLEIELMRSAVNGKLGLWQTLQALADDLTLPAELFTELVDLAHRQSAALETMHRQVRGTAWSGTG
ncbi:NAD-dependent epimerase/dehydratase family protein [Ruania halotolerans]|uniref:NAD-dependent epimerase/dehydratase family protein n=1 Tax=Ruania halotolerans TaxID=2897773 RepID=UPI001E51BEF9|nr:NAD-dependent epimerase/dehydratase family protein [Ruania halotolerans]UFU05516.1 NAD-dependent epimerase/dehydratase family protein [Ruania halotolerans]